LTLFLRIPEVIRSVFSHLSISNMSHDRRREREKSPLDTAPADSDSKRGTEDNDTSQQATANRIKLHHTHLRKQQDPLGAWARLKQDRAQLQQYAHDMCTLGSKFWASDASANSGSTATATGALEGHTTEAGAPAANVHHVDANTKALSDRLTYACDVIESYFCDSARVERRRILHDDALAAASASTQRTTKAAVQLPPSLRADAAMPGFFTSAMKDRRRTFYAEHQRMMTDAEATELAQQLAGDAFVPMFDVVAPNPGAGGSTLRELVVLDAGSCYNPYASALAARDWTIPCARGWWADAPGGCASSSLIPAVAACDLGPMPGSGVLRCDLANLRPVFDAVPALEADTASRSCASSSAAAPPAATLQKIFPLAASECNRAAYAELQQAASTTADTPAADQNTAALVYADRFVSCSAHAVIFSLVLSYMPCAEMRLRCCYNALHVLRPGGLLIVISTRTQGSRHDGWEARWIAALTALGFELVRKDVRTKIVGIVVRRPPYLPGRDARTSNVLGAASRCDAEYDAAFAALPEATRVKGLEITADTRDLM
jgi:hypothetical protein